MLRLKQIIQGLKNVDVVEDELELIEKINLSDEFTQLVSQEQFHTLLNRAQLLFAAQELSPATFETLEANAIIHLLYKNIKLGVMLVLTKVLSKRVDSLSITPQVQKFLTQVLDFMHELLLADEITLQAYALASFKMYEKVKDPEDPESTEIMNQNYCLKIMQKAQKIAKKLIIINLSNEQLSNSFLEKYELLTALCLKSSNYFSNYSGLVLLSQLLNTTDPSYHLNLRELFRNLNFTQEILLKTDRLFCLLSTSEELIEQIFTEIEHKSLPQQIFFFGFLHDGVFIDICMPYKFQEAKFEPLAPSYSPQLQKHLIAFYKKKVEPFIKQLAETMRTATLDSQDDIIDNFKLQAIFLKCAVLFSIDTLSLFDDLKQSLEILKQNFPDNQIYPYIVQNILTIILTFNQEKLQIEEVANLLIYQSKNSPLSKVNRAKIFFLIMYAPEKEQNPQVDELKQVQLKKKFSKLVKEVEGSAKLEYFVFHCLEIYFNSPNLKELDSDIEKDVLNKFVDYIQEKSSLTVEKAFCIDEKLSNTRGQEKSFSEQIDNLSKSSEILHCISQIRFLLPKIPANDKDFISQKLMQIMEEIK